MYRGIGLVAFITTVIAFSTGCGLRAVSPRHTVDDCYREIARKIAAKPAWDCLTILDRRCIPLQPIYDACNAYWPNCVLYRKFYYWPTKIETRVSQTPTGRVTHQIRMYFNLLSTCNPGVVDPGRTHGDVAEFYDRTGRFMGLAVYMGNGLYVPLSYRDDPPTRTKQMKGNPDPSIRSGWGLRVDTSRKGSAAARPDQGVCDE